MIKKYCTWNNKGGVGKTFLTYLIATGYAKAHPDEDIIVVDMCPQANLTEMLLGGNGKGQENTEKLFEEKRTVAAYIQKRYTDGKTRILGNETSYFVCVDRYNPKLPSNIYLLPGDNDLDLCANLITYWGNGPEKDAWKTSRLVLNDILSAYLSTTNEDRPKTVFIDCNPSFSPYTELALLAANRLLIPCTADHSSIRGLKNVVKLIYDDSAESIFTQFTENLSKFNLTAPLTHAVLLNKSRSLDKTASKVFKSVMNELRSVVHDINTSRPHNFTSNNIPFLNIKDGNTLAAVLHYEGALLEDISVGNSHEVYGETITVNEEQKLPLLSNIQDIIKIL